MKDLYYEVTENGYHIYDRNDNMFHVHQYEPYIPDKMKSYQENAEGQIHGLILEEYAGEVIDGTIIIDDVPEDYRTEVEALLPNNPYGIPNEKYLEIVAAEQQNYRNQLAQEVAEC